MDKRNLAERFFTTDVSGIRKVGAMAMGLKDSINLSIGQPHFEVPESIREAAKKAIDEGMNSYTETQGIGKLVDAFQNQLGGYYAKDEILTTLAVSGGLVLSFMALLNPGDEVLISDPYYVMHKQLALLLGVRPVYYETYDCDFQLPLEKIEALITNKTKAIVICSPSNPTGMVYSREQLKALAEILDKHGIVAISDEIYDLFCYDSPFVSIAEFYRANTVVLKGFSKSHAMTGWRLGYAAGPKELIQAMAKFQQFTFVCAPSMVQVAGLEALKVDMTPFAEDYKNKRNKIYNGLIDAGYEVIKPAGAFYILPKAPTGSGVEFVKKCIAENLLVIPGSVFSEKDTHFRISYAASDETIERGLEVLRKII